MSEEPRLRIRGKLYAYPTSSKLGDAALIEQLTGLTHSEWRQRYVDSVTAALEADEDEEGTETDEDSAITIGIVGMAVSRENPRWPRTKVVEFVNDLDFDEIAVEGGDAGPPGETEPSDENRSKNGQEPVSTSSSDSESGLKKSTIPQTSGRSTSPT